MNISKGHLRRYLAVLVFALFGSIGIASDFETFSVSHADRGIIVFSEPKPEFPARMIRQGISNGQVLLSINVDEFGYLKDWLILEASDKELVNAINDVIEYWYFEPAIEDGRATSAVQLLPVQFDAGRAVKTSKKEASSFLQSNFLPSRESSDSAPPREAELRLAKFSDLDNTPTIIERVQPALTEEIYKANIGVSVTFEFYVDTKGRVRLPTLKGVTGKPSMDAILIAQAALEKWRFEPLLSRGKPVTMKFAQAIHFSFLSLN